MKLEEVLSTRKLSQMEEELVKDGWEETHGIALMTNPKYPNIGLDLNTEKIWIIPVREKGPFNTSQDDFLDIFDTVVQLRKWLKSPGERDKDWVSSTPIDWAATYIDQFMKDAKVGDKVQFKEYDETHKKAWKDRKTLVGTIVRASDNFAYIKVGSKEHLVSHRDVINSEHVPGKGFVLTKIED